MIFSQKHTSVIFVVDPMCSWCWGFSPVMHTLTEQLSEKFQFSLVVGGLRTKGQMTWDDASKHYLETHWRQVGQKTGQKFGTTLFEQAHFDYDTYPACKAVVSVRELFGMQSAFDYLHNLQEAFYVQSMDITQEENLTAAIEVMGLDSEVFTSFYQSERAQTLMDHDFAKARSMGATAFPSVVIIDKDGHLICQKGYRSMLEIKQLLGENNA